MLGLIVGILAGAGVFLALEWHRAREHRRWIQRELEKVFEDASAQAGPRIVRGLPPDGICEPHTVYISETVQPGPFTWKRKETKP